MAQTILNDFNALCDNVKLFESTQFEIKCVFEQNLYILPYYLRVNACM